jgi:hypothetical protein
MSEQGPKRRGGRPRASAETMRAPMVPIDKSLLGPAMLALPSDRWRAAAVARFMVRTNTAAVLLAGFGAVPGGPTAGGIKAQAYQIFHDPRMLAALHELGQKYMTAKIPDAIGAVEQIVDDAEHPHRLKAAQFLLERAYPHQTTHRVEVAHTVDAKDIASKLQQVALRFGLDPDRVLARPATVVDGEVAEVEPA